MKIRLLAVGRPRDPGLSALHDAYAARILGIHRKTLHEKLRGRA